MTDDILRLARESHNIATNYPGGLPELTKGRERGMSFAVGMVAVALFLGLIDIAYAIKQLAEAQKQISWQIRHWADKDGGE